MGPEKLFELREKSDYAEKNPLIFGQFDWKIFFELRNNSDYKEFTVVTEVPSKNSEVYI